MTTTLVPIEQVSPPPTVEVLPSSLAGWLERFSRMTPDAIAEYLRTFGIKGTPRDPEDCGFAVFFRRVLGERLRFSNRCVHDWQGHHLLPPSCLDFMIHFDHGRYPFLVRDDMMSCAGTPLVASAGGFVTSAVWAQARAFNTSDIETLLSMFKMPAELVAVS